MKDIFPCPNCNNKKWKSCDVFETTNNTLWFHDNLPLKAEMTVDLLQTIYKDGKITKTEDFSTIRKRLE